MFVLRLTVFFSPHPAATEIYTLSLHDALPIYEALSRTALSRTRVASRCASAVERAGGGAGPQDRHPVHAVHLAQRDRKSTRLNSSHRCISYAVFCLKKKKHKKLDNNRYRTC